MPENLSSSWLDRPIRRKLELYAFRYVRELITEDMIEAVLFKDSDEERIKKGLSNQLEGEVLPKIAALIRLAYEAGWNEGQDEADDNDERITLEVKDMIEKDQAKKEILPHD